MHFIPNGYKRFSKTNSSNPEQRVPLISQVNIQVQKIRTVRKQRHVHIIRREKKEKKGAPLMDFTIELIS